MAPDTKIKDLRDWLLEVEKLGELKRVTKEVDPNLEMSAFTYLNGQNEGAPTLLFENPKGFDSNFKVLFNPIGNSLNRLTLAMRQKPGISALKLIETLKNNFNVKIPPVSIDPKDAPIYENVVEGDEIDLFSVPVPKFWPRDGGNYIGTGCAIITKDPETGRINLGTYRQMVQGKATVGYYSSPGKDTILDREKWWAQGKPCPVVACYGIDPLLFAVSCTGFPRRDCEYDYAGGIAGEPIETVPGKYTGLPIPARAELVIEGFSYPDKGMPEGPFGEFTGYYGRPGSSTTPIIDIKGMYYRNNPIMTSALMADRPGSNEMALIRGLLRGAEIWRQMEASGLDGIKGVWGEPAASGGIFALVVSLKQQYPGHAQMAGALAAQCVAGAYSSKFIFVVDDDIDPTDLRQVIWAAGTRCRASEDIDIMRNTWSTFLDPSKNPPSTRPFGSKAIIYACKDFENYDNFSKRTALTREQYENARARWEELDLPGQFPEIRVFDDLK